MRWIRWGPMLLLVLAAGTETAQPAINILANGNFHNSAGLSGWERFGNVSHDPTKDVDGAPDSGSALLTQNNELTALVQCVNLPTGAAGGPGRLAGATFLHPGFPGAAVIVATFFSGPACGGSPGSVEALEPATPNMWSRRMRDFTLPTDSRSVRMELILSGPARANFDALSLEVGTLGPPSGGPDLTIEVVQLFHTVRPGGSLLLDYELRNVGNQPTQGPVTVSLSAPPNSLFSAELQIPNTLGPNGSILGKHRIFSGLDAIPGAYEITGTVSGGGDVNPSNNTDQAFFVIMEPREAAALFALPPLSTLGRRPSDD